jgi:hypothetical protein
MKNHYRAWVSNENARTAAAELLQQQHHQQQQQQQQQQQGEAGSLPNTWQDRGQLQGSTPQQQQQQSPEQQQKLPIGMTLLFGGVAGLVAQTVTYPLVSCLHAIQHNCGRACAVGLSDLPVLVASSASAAVAVVVLLSRLGTGVNMVQSSSNHTPVKQTGKHAWSPGTGCPWLVAFGMLMTFVCWLCCCGTGCHQAADASGSPPSTASKSC